MGLTFEQAAPMLHQFLAEDLGTGDLTATVLPTKQIKGQFIAKQAGVISGIELADFVYRLFESDVLVKSLVHDGDLVTAGTKIASVHGDAQTLLAAERVILNLMQRMSGIASATAQAVQSLDNPAVGILDTRKTAPGLRYFDKYAVQTGGGINHRMGLYDAVMLKDNHWQLFDNLKQTVATLRREVGPTKCIEVEVETPTELLLAIESDVDMILIDNQSPETVAQWCQQIPPHIQTEASGGIEADNLYSYGQTGVDFISLGYLTNSVQALDISFEISI